MLTIVNIYSPSAGQTISYINTYRVIFNHASRLLLNMNLFVSSVHFNSAANGIMNQVFLWLFLGVNISRLVPILTLSRFKCCCSCPLSTHWLDRSLDCSMYFVQLVFRVPELYTLNSLHLTYVWLRMPTWSFSSYCSKYTLWIIRSQPECDHHVPTKLVVDRCFKYLLL